MGSVASVPSGLAYLTQPGGLLSTLSPAISTSELQSASPEDIVSLSVAAIQAQIADGLLGVSPTNPTPAELPVTAGDTTGNTSNTSVLPGVASADLTNATPQQNAEINDQALSLQQAQALFDPTPATSSIFNLTG
jgi:hypothetical protein